ncbi:MAG TPA: RNA polymerase sigma factor [Chitinophagaceae bacterium]|nr:RNA polymerase sigma factor [Chitinophagaceae bacterium]
MATITNQQTDHHETKMKECLLGNDQRLFSKLYDHYSSALFSLILKWIKDTETAQNLLQDVFVKAWRSKELYDSSKGKIFTWLYNIARHICIDHLRSKAYKKSKQSVFSDDISVIIPAGNTDNMSPDTIGLRKLVNTLRSEEKEVIELMYFKGYTQREIAEIMDTPLGTVKTRMSRAIKSLRYYFKKDWKDATKTISLN